jgi:hypothetical protein
MTKRITGNLDLVTDDIGLNSHLFKIHGNRVELAKALANIFLRFEVNRTNHRKISWFYWPDVSRIDFSKASSI